VPIAPGLFTTRAPLWQVHSLLSYVIQKVEMHPIVQWLVGIGAG
jgi:hypothetical protein